MTEIVNLSTDKIELCGSNDFDSRDNAWFSVTQFYSNDTNEDITVTLRNNLAVTVNKLTASGVTRGVFTIRRVYQFYKHFSINSIINNINEHIDRYGDTNQELLMIRDILLPQRTSRFNNSQVVVNYHTDFNFIKEHKIVYERELDLLFNLGGYSVKNPHPFSKEGQGIQQYEEFVRDKKCSGIFLEVIDNDSFIKSRYIYVAKQLIELPTIKDLNKPSGVYFNIIENKRLDETEVIPTYLSFDEAEQIGVYRTKEEAMTGGDPEVFSKIEMANLNKELLEHKKCLAKLNAEVESMETDNLKLKKELEQDKMMRENKAEIRKDHYEQRSYERKDWHETLKIGTAIAGGAIAAFALMRKK